ncbi:hypothetical protein P9112_002065 [Eukaryota sp. TZLM1-RC]
MDSYNFLQQPRAVIEQTSKPYRDGTMPQNMMYDRRIVRGSTINTPMFRSQMQQHFSPQKSSPSRKRVKSRLKSHSSTSTLVSDGPPPVEGRLHNEIQTEQYLEEIVDQPEDINIALQTDPFLERPPTPEFVPVKSGVDVTTQIEEGDLFDFDREVVPIVDVLVSKALEQGLAEVLEEEEIAALRRRRDDFSQRRNAELSQTERIEAMERRKRDEIERRKRQIEEKKEREEKVSKKVVVANFAKSLVENLETRVVGSLERSGYFNCKVEQEVESVILPNMITQASTLVQKRKESREVLNTIILSAIKRISGLRVN